MKAEGRDFALLPLLLLLPVRNGDITEIMYCAKYFFLLSTLTPAHPFPSMTPNSNLLREEENLLFLHCLHTGPNVIKLSHVPAFKHHFDKQGRKSPYTKKWAWVKALIEPEITCNASPVLFCCSFLIFFPSFFFISAPLQI